MKTKVRIKLGKGLADSHVYINGVEVPALSVEVRLDNDTKFTTAKIELPVEDMEIEGEYITIDKRKVENHCENCEC
jgi:hypothetical protein